MKSYWPHNEWMFFSYVFMYFLFMTIFKCVFSTKCWTGWKLSLNKICWKCLHTACWLLNTLRFTSYQHLAVHLLMDDGDLLIRSLCCKYISFSPWARISCTWNQHLISHLINHRLQHLRWAAATSEQEVLAITEPSHPFTFQIDGTVTEMALGAACQSTTL